MAMLILQDFRDLRERPSEARAISRNGSAARLMIPRWCCYVGDSMRNPFCTAAPASDIDHSWSDNDQRSDIPCGWCRSGVKLLSSLLRPEEEG